MDKLPVGQLPDLQQSNNDDEIMVITNSEYNQLKKEKISDLITDFTSTNENNALTKGTDGKMFVTDFGNASNITEGTLPVSVLPDIPKDKLPEIETDDLPDSGITAGAYTYPTDIVVNSKGQVTSITEGQPGANNANQDLSNLGPLGLDKLNQSKALETGSVSSDADVYADVQKYAHSTFDLSKFTVVGSPNITEDGIASGFGVGNYLKIANLASAPQDSLIVSIEFTPVQNTTDERAQCLFIICSDDPAKRIYLYVQQSGTNVSLDINRTVVTTGAVNINSVNTAKVVWNKVDSTQGKFSLYVNDNLIGTQEFNTSDVIFTNDFNVGFFGSSALTVYYGSIDLKSVAIWSDGVPVFNGNQTGTDTYIIDGEEVEIPYTLSKTGSKIVDAAYRDRVQDMYEQYGYAPYYTIDEENQNFTLPMGEIYGMINQGGSGGGLEVGDIGIAAFGIDESKGLRRYLNGSILTLNANSQKFANKLKAAAASYPSLVCSEDEWQTISSSSVGGQCGKFVIDETAGTIRLPKIIMPIQGLSDLTNLAEIVEAGVPNITGTFMNNGRAYDSADTAKYTGAFSRNNTTQNTSNAGASEDGRIINFNASNSNPIYGNSTTVQQEQIQYPYFIQIATGVEYEVNISNNIELNNPFTLFDSKYSDTPLYNASWLLSNGTYYSKSVYVTAYEALIVENNTEIDAGTSVQLPSGTTYVKRGLSVKLSTTEDITDYDFVINTTNETFRLPVKVKLAGSKMVVGNGIVLGVTDGTSNYGIKHVIGAGSGWVVRQDMYGAAVGTGNTGQVFPPDNVGLGITTDPTKSGLELCDSNLYLYYYIGETVQNANLINAGVLSEKANADLSNCTKPYVTETYKNGTSWYRLWSDGWCEQGGYNSNTGTYTVTMMKEFADTNYTLLTQYAETTNSTNQVTPNELSTWNKTTSSFTTYSDFAGKIWLAFGYVA